ncbi:hypothetical protein JG688_00017677 [Phytophthora aleatoria]|uniref:Uncharacterized protein n=1 Tax=Phytophthora aleatoria TaxID=2496075 RepID=A0A8J5IDE9_9STRA|nr:hypothetical protein JG688_00017677 [Phytophthora aleatoria]
MPKQSERQRFLQDIVKGIAIDIWEEEDDDLLGGEQGEHGRMDGESVFRESTRMDKASFTSMADEIQGQSVFSNESTYPQAPVWIQLAAALDRFGNYGTGASLKRSQRLWGIGKGAVDDDTARIVLALVDLPTKYVRWPTSAERKMLSHRRSLLSRRSAYTPRQFARMNSGRSLTLKSLMAVAVLRADSGNHT